MDIPREGAARRRRMRLTLYSVVGIGAAVLITLGLSRLKPAPPSVDRSTVWIDTVKTGAMDVQVRGLGTLVPEQIQWIPAITEGRVVRRFLLPGVAVKPDTVLLQLSNPELQQETLNAEWQLKAAQADYNNLKAQLQKQYLDQQSAVTGLQAQYRQAKLQADVDQVLASKGIASKLKSELSEVTAKDLDERTGIAQKQLKMIQDSIQTQLAASEAQVEQDRALYQLKQNQMNALMVRAGYSGVLQEVSVEVGQQVQPGTTLAKVVDPTKLKAQLQIAETQAKDIQIGQSASVDTHNGIIPGMVTRIDPAVVNGTVTVDVALDGKLPEGARPDLSVDGTVEITHLSDATYVGRPAFGQAHSTIGLFKLVDNGKEAVRCQVKVGEASVNEVQILQGLNVGDQVILSDMSRWDSFDRIRLE